MTEQKLFSLDDIDDGFKGLNLRSCDGDHPSALRGISLMSNDSNLHQHGKIEVYSSALYLNKSTAL